jgi:peptidoglycan lytic transglycosylase
LLLHRLVAFRLQAVGAIFDCSGECMRRERAGKVLARTARFTALACACLALAHCSSSQYSPRVVEEGETVPKGGGTYRIGQPYNINGRTYVPHENPKYRADGVASWYGRDFHGRLTANGEIYDMHSISAAHTTMPLPSYARVTNLENGRSIVVRVNDRGPYARNRIIDVSIGAAKALEFYRKGLAHVRVEYVGPAPLEGSDDRMLLATLREGSPAPAPSKVMVASAKPFLPGAGEAAGAERGSGRKMEAVLATEAKSSARLPPRTKSASAADDVPIIASQPAPEPSLLGLMSGRGLY